MTTPKAATRQAALCLKRGIRLMAFLLFILFSLDNTPMVKLNIPLLSTWVFYKFLFHQTG
jgi:hypothetical protein